MMMMMMMTTRVVGGDADFMKKCKSQDLWMNKKHFIAKFIFWTWTFLNKSKPHPFELNAKHIFSN